MFICSFVYVYFISRHLIRSWPLFHRRLLEHMELSEKRTEYVESENGFISSFKLVTLSVVDKGLLYIKC